ncbi:MAG TPA: metallophosphoesterase family protein [Acidimicrobiales bacterium]|nr:metallophosphoesterase family protein [Acidimicrobiales bacterium]
MATWFTADLHLGHRNIIGYCRRPWPDVEAMNEALVGRWNDVVAPDDTVWVLGDVALGPIDETLATVGRLAGHKVLVAGNHDRCWAGHGRRSRRWVDRYTASGFEAVHQGAVTLEVADTTLTACHFPYRGDSHDRERYVEHRPADRGQWLLHGHVHDRWRQWGRMINVGVDAWNFTPVPETDLAALIAAGPADRPPL